MIQKLSKHLATIVVATLVVVAAIAFFGDAVKLSRVIHPIRIGVGAAVTIAFWPLIWPVFRGRKLVAANWLGAGLTLLGLSLAASSALALAGNFGGFLTNFGTPVRTVVAAAVTIGLGLVMVSPSTDIHAHMTPKWTTYAVIAGFALGIGALFL